MIDFLRANPWCSREEYLWGMSVAQVRLAAVDFSHIEYLKTKEEMQEAAKKRSVDLESDVDALNDLGIPIL